LVIKTGCLFQEFFNAEIGFKSFIQAQEDENGETFQRMSHLANKLNIILVAGKYRAIINAIWINKPQGIKIVFIYRKCF